MRIVRLVLLFGFVGVADAADTAGDMEARFLHVWTLAKDRNDAGLRERLDELYESARLALGRRDTIAVELLIRDAERSVDLDPGGRSMYGQPVAALSLLASREFKVQRVALARAMKAKDSAKIRDAIADIRKTLGESAGLPDSIARGASGSAILPTRKGSSELFVGVVRSDPAMVAILNDGKPVPGRHTREFASSMIGVLQMLPAIGKDLPAESAKLRTIVEGCAKATIAQQLPAGFFRYPDLRTQRPSEREIAERVLAVDPTASVGGWLTSPDPEGATNADAAECGIALLRAGKAFENRVWLDAGRKAADWLKSQPCVAAYHHNAESVSLSCEAFRAFGEVAYLDAAWETFTVGISPGQADNGRWYDPLEARTISHFAILRCLHDLLDVLPIERKDDRERVRRMAARAMRPILAEWDAIGPTSTVASLAAFLRHRTLVGQPKGLKAAIETTAKAIVSKCSRDGKYRWGIGLQALSSLRPLATGE